MQNEIYFDIEYEDWDDLALKDHIEWNPEIDAESLKEEAHDPDEK